MMTPQRIVEIQSMNIGAPMDECLDAIIKLRFDNEVKTRQIASLEHQLSVVEHKKNAYLHRLIELDEIEVAGER
jgi:hypothetical protein